MRPRGLTSRRMAAAERTADGESGSMVRTAGTSSLSGEVVSIAPIANESFGPYTIIGKLGHGGMAAVFLALASGQSGFQKLLVLKRLHAHLEDEPMIGRMFHDEIKLASRLSHPHVVQTVEVGASGGRPYLAMEYLDGQPLNAVQRRCAELGRALPAVLAARIVSDALDGLHYAHEATDYDGTPLSIVHRDVSPHNLFVTYDGRVKVLDFGIAKATTQESLTQAGTIKGKLAYMAPEQACGVPVDRRADVWGMGVVMWELLARRRLFRRGTDVEMLSAVLGDGIAFVTEIDPALSRPLAEICDHALQRDPDARWQSALAMKEAIDDWLASTGNASSPAALAGLMKELFTTDIVERRERIRECVEQVRSSRSGNTSLSRLLPRIGDEPSVPSVSVERPVATRAFPNRSRWIAIAVVLALSLFGAGVVGWSALRSSPDAPSDPPMATAADSAPHLASPSTGTVAHSLVASPPSTVTTAVEPPETTVSSEGVGPPLARSPSPRPRAITPPRTHAPPPSPTPPAVATTAPASTGHLTLDAAPYAIVSLAGRRLGITPIDVDLPAGTYTLSLRNPEYGIETSYRVVIRSGEIVRRTVALE